MPLPFVWLGALVAALFLVGAMALFGVAAKLLDLTAGQARATVLPGLVGGFRDWADSGRRAVVRRISSSPWRADAGDEAAVEEGAARVPPEPVRGHVH